MVIEMGIEWYQDDKGRWFAYKEDVEKYIEDEIKYSIENREKDLINFLEEEYGLGDYDDEIMNLKELINVYSTNLEIITEIFVELKKAFQYFRDEKESCIEELSNVLKRKFKGD